MHAMTRNALRSIRRNASPDEQNHDPAQWQARPSAFSRQ